MPEILEEIKIRKPRAKKSAYYNEDGKFDNNRYYQDNKDKLRIIRTSNVTCECGLKLKKGNLTKHLKTKSHQKRLNDQSSSGSSSS